MRGVDGSVVASVPVGALRVRNRYLIHAQVINKYNQEVRLPGVSVAEVGGQKEEKEELKGVRHFCDHK